MMSKVRPPAEHLLSALRIQEKLLTGPGPSNLTADASKCMSLPLIGHMHADFLKIMDDVKEGIKYLFQTQSPWSIALSGAGHMAMEAACFNLLEPGEKVLVCQNGLWGQRFASLSNRCGVNPILLEKPPGDVFKLEEIEEVLKRSTPQAVFVTHGESSAGTLQPLEGLGALCHRYGANLIVDAVVTAGGCPLFMDDWELDCVYTGSQKCLSCCPGISPISFSERALYKVMNRKRPVLSFYLDLMELGDYWCCNGSSPRKYHHTAPISLMYGLREGLRGVAEEGLEASWKRHQEVAEHFYKGLDGLGLSPMVEDASKRVPCVTTIKVPQDVDWKAVTAHCLNKCHVEVSGGLGPTAGKAMRVGLMGANAHISVADRVIAALKEAIEANK